MESLDDGNYVCCSSFTFCPNVELITFFSGRFSTIKSRAGSKRKIHESYSKVRKNTHISLSELLICGSSRAAKRIREAAQQFTLVARGLEGTSFGYATVSM